MGRWWDFAHTAYPYAGLGSGPGRGFPSIMMGVPLSVVGPESDSLVPGSLANTGHRGLADEARLNVSGFVFIF